jgi:hypothetical protein
MISKMLYASIAALLVSGCAAEHHAETYVIGSATAHAGGYSAAEPGHAETLTVTETSATGELALAEAAASSHASTEDWWGNYAVANSESLSVTEIADGGILAVALSEDDADVYGDAWARADADAYADGYITVFKKYWEPEPHDDDDDKPEPHPEPCDGWWCHEEEDDTFSRRLMEAYAETYEIGSASAHAGGASWVDGEEGLAATETVTSTTATGELALAEAAASSHASFEDWWGAAEANSESLSVTEIADGGILAVALSEDDADVYGDAFAHADADAYADGYITVFKKYWEPEPHPEPHPAPEPHCDGWWCHDDE